MTTPTPPAQDGERERLIAMFNGLYSDWPATYRMEKNAADMLRADAKTIRTQSAELADLRAQVDGLKELIRNWTGCSPEELRAAEVAALAPPQPVAKEK